jgi:hypothetical protein
MDYWQFIEKQKQLVQLGTLEEHHIYPKFDRQTNEVIYLSLNAHADASVYQSEEWGRCCFHHRLLPYVSSELQEQARYWCGDALRSWHREKPEIAREVCKRAGEASAVSNPDRDYTEMGKKGWAAQRKNLGSDGVKKMCSNGGKIGSSNTNSQKWRCKFTGYVSTAAGVVSHQKGLKLNTDKTNREKL